MIRFFKTLQPAVLVLVPVIILIFWVRIIFHSDPVSDSNSLPLWDLISAFFNIFPSWVNFILLIALLTIEAIYLNLLMNRHEILYKNTFLPALIFSLVISSTPLLMQFHPVHVINLLVLVILDRCFSLFKTDFPRSALFDCAFLSGCAAIIYFPAIILFPFLLITLIIMRPFNLKEWIILITGFILPYFFMSVLLFWDHNLIPFWEDYFERFESIHAELMLTPAISWWVLSAFSFLMLIYSLTKLRLNFRKNIIRTRSNQQIIFLLMILGFGWVILAQKIENIQLVFFTIPFAVFISYLFVSAKRRAYIFEYVFWVFVILILWNHFV